ncbi:hypothetical protein [uncultured Umboniibacter sp.]|uniref:hypothetical protein n=1 Tax=uncultured Umboniibacter sp. TaxID=1798917 RepID=UPI00263523A6|nr:hypothetical protein [uncultured Umboniibacter sp.]
MKKRILLMVSRPRTGSSYAGELLAKSGPFDYRGEIFNSQAPYNLKPAEFAEIFGCSMNTMAPREQATLVRENALKVLSFLGAKAGEDRVVVVKLFDNHVSKTVLETLMSSPEVGCFALDRAILPSYISLLKATVSNSWDTQDTSSLTVEFKGSPFNGWFRQQTVWFERVQGLLAAAEKPCQLVRYEELSAADHGHAQALLIGAAEFGLGVSLGAVTSVGETKLKKQDKAADYSNTVSNYNHMMRAPGIYSTRGGQDNFWEMVTRAPKI